LRKIKICPLLVHPEKGNYILKNVCIIAAICCSAPSLADEAELAPNPQRIVEKGRAVGVEEAEGSSQIFVPINPRPFRSPSLSTKEYQPENNDRKDAYVSKEEYETLKREVEALKDQIHLQRIGEKSPEQENSSQNEASPPAGDEGENPQADDDFDIAEGSRQIEAEDSRRELDTFLRGKKVLFRRGELALEYNLGYSEDITNNVCLDADFDDSYCPEGSVIAPKFINHSIDTSFLVRYGLADHLELDLTIPYSYIEQKQDFRPFKVPTSLRRTENTGIGDISLAVRYTAWTESGSTPNITLSMNVKSKTGKESTISQDAGNQSPGLGTGFWNVGAGISLVKTIDPVVFFSSLGYTSTLEKNGIEPGDQIPYSFGTGFSMNDKVSFSTSLSGTAVRRTKVNGREINGSSKNISTLQLGFTVQLSKRLFIEPYVGFGLNEEASDFVLGFSMPYRFEKRFPLPFLPD
jgi:hypothetical protein